MRPDRVQVYGRAMTVAGEDRFTPSSVIVACWATYALCWAAVVASVVQNLVLNPLAVAPGQPLSRIWADVERAGESLDAWLVVAIAVVPLLVATGILRQAARGGPERVRGTTMMLLGVVVSIAPLHWLSSFAPNIALADTYDTTGAAHSPWGAVVYALSGLAAALLMMGAVLRARHR